MTGGADGGPEAQPPEAGRDRVGGSFEPVDPHRLTVPEHRHARAFARDRQLRADRDVHAGFAPPAGDGHGSVRLEPKYSGNVDDEKLRHLVSDGGERLAGRGAPRDQSRHPPQRGRGFQELLQALPGGCQVAAAGLGGSPSQPPPRWTGRETIIQRPPGGVGGRPIT